MGRLVVVAIGVVALTLLGAGAVGSRVAALPRATADRPDEISGSQVHVIYVVPSDGVDRSLDTDGALDASVSNFQAWLRGQTGGRALRIDTYQGQPDISFVRLGKTDAQIAATGAFVRDTVEHDLIALGFNSPSKLLAVYYDGTSTFACGGGAWPPALPWTAGMLYLRATYGAGFLCYEPARSNAGLQIMDLAILHELLHTIGMVPTCAPHHTRAGHVSDSPQDLMYAGVQPWVPTTLDVGRDDYFDAPVAGCPDLADSPYLGSAVSSVPSRLAITVLGRGHVRSSPTGIDCPPTCAVQFPQGTRVLLTATATAGWRFSIWRGACSGRGFSCRLALNAATAATATFAKLPPKCRKGQRSTIRRPCRR